MYRVPCVVKFLFLGQDEITWNALWKQVFVRFKCAPIQIVSRWENNILIPRFVQTVLHSPMEGDCNHLLNVKSLRLFRMPLRWGRDLCHNLWSRADFFCPAKSKESWLLVPVHGCAHQLQRRRIRKSMRTMFYCFRGRLFCVFTGTTQCLCAPSFLFFYFILFYFFCKPLLYPCFWPSCSQMHGAWHPAGCGSHPLWLLGSRGVWLFGACRTILSPPLHPVLQMIVSFELFNKWHCPTQMNREVESGFFLSRNMLLRRVELRLVMLQEYSLVFVVDQDK